MKLAPHLHRIGNDIVAAYLIVTDDGVTVVDAGTRLAEGAKVVIDPAGRRGGSTAEVTLPREAFVYLDPHLVVVNKPSGVSTVPFEEGERGALVDRVRVALNRSGKADSNAPLFVVHRIDKETSGLVVFARTWLAKRHLAHLFREHDIERRYLALVNGYFERARETFDTNLVENRGDGLRGSAKQSGLGVRAVTLVKLLGHAKRAEASLVECRLETGRTHQIRIHLAEAGHPLVGERVYSRHYEGPSVEAPRLMLHAATLGFTHPAEPDREMKFECELPDDFKGLAAKIAVQLP
jgi:23S rRNA pseudouridine1911/1915/1917 synthase